MTAKEFVQSLMQAARTAAAAKAESFSSLPDGLGPDQALARWYRSLPEADRGMARQAFAHFMEGGAFLVLAVLDGLAQLPNQDSSFELYAVSGDSRERLSNLSLGG